MELLKAGGADLMAVNLTGNTVRPETPDPGPYTLNPKPQTPNPKPRTKNSKP